MDLALRVAEIVAPVFVLAGLGFLWVRRGEAFPVDFVTRLGTSFAVPCLIFATLVATEIDPAAVPSMDDLAGLAESPEIYWATRSAMTWT